MTSSEKIIRLIRAFKNDNKKLVDEIIRSLIVENEDKGSYKISKELRHISSMPYISENNSESKMAFAHVSRVASSENDKAFEFRDPTVDKSCIVLNSTNELIFKEIVETYQKRKILIKAGVEVENKILLFGPPGTGKTLFAYVMANELKLPILHIYLDNVVSSFLGETGKNISRVFREAKKQRCLVFLDEFESLAKVRDDSQDVSEFKRVVSVLLQNIDEVDADTVLIAATNLDQLIDKAIRRRFSYELNLDLLDKKSRDKLLRLYLKKYPNIDHGILVRLSANMSGALINKIVNKSIKNWLLRDKSMNLNDILISNFAEYYFTENKLDSRDKKSVDELIKLVKRLRSYNNKLYTYQYLEDIFSVPKSTIYDLANKNGI